MRSSNARVESHRKLAGVDRCFRSVLMLAAVGGFCLPGSAQFYVQTNLDSDVPGMAVVTDTNLVGAWGVAHSGTSPWWVNSTLGGVSLVLNGLGEPSPTNKPLVVTLPLPGGQSGSSIATALAFNGDTNRFLLAPDKASLFLFATRNGTISGWNPAVDPTQAVVKVDHSTTADYVGLTLASRGGVPTLYAANFRSGQIEVFDGDWNPVTLAPEAFRDARLPAGLTVFNVQALGDELYVTYAETNVFVNFGGRGQGAVNVFDTEGKLLRRLRHGFWMNAPWGVALAPAGFGPFGNHVLIGMFGSGAIAAFDTRRGEFHGVLRDTDGFPLIIAKGLWGLGFGNGGSAGDTNTLYFASDFAFGGGLHGLFGTISPTGAMGPGDEDQDVSENGRPDDGPGSDGNQTGGPHGDHGRP